jgi:hypothetical protein
MEKVMPHRNVVRITVILLFLCVSASCATVPSETVTLSQKVGEDLVQLQQGYRQTIRLSFSQMRERGLAVIDNYYVPAYLKSFVKDGELMDIAKEENWEDLEGWARAAIDDIDAKRKSFVDDLNQKEEALLKKVDAAFARSIRANAAVTGHLNSVLKVKSLQDQVLDAAGMEDLGEGISDAITEASNFAAKYAKDVRAAGSRKTRSDP